MKGRKNGLATALFLMSLLLTAAPGQAQLNLYAWNGGNGNWSAANNWLSDFPGTVPNALNAGAYITGNVKVSLDLSLVRLGGMQVEAGNSVVFQDMPGYLVALEFGPGSIVQNYGIISLPYTTDGSRIVGLSGGAVTFSGTGEIVLGDRFKSSLVGLGTFINEAGHTIRGCGYIDSNNFNFTNRGNIVADNGVLRLQYMTLTNQNIVSASGAENILELVSSSGQGGLYNPGTGLIRLDGANLKNATIGSGKVEIAGGSNFTYPNIYMDANTEVTVNSNQYLVLASGVTLTNI